MKLAILTSNLSSLPQPSVEEFGELADRRYRSIISNRPDGEAPDQPTWTDLKAAALARGMEAVHIPVVASQIDEADIRAFREALESLPKPIAAFLPDRYPFDVAVGAGERGLSDRRGAHQDRSEGRL